MKCTTDVGRSAFVRDARHECLEGGASLECRQGAPDGEENFLEKILLKCGLCFIARNDAGQEAAVRGHDLAKHGIAA